MNRPRRGFTLIELLIVVAIIAILAAIAVPNFLEAQVRAKYARVVSDFRSIAVGIESYAVDINDYPRNFGTHVPPRPTDLYWSVPPDLSTPVAYLSSATFVDPFALYKENDPLVRVSNYSYHRVLSTGERDRLPWEYWPPDESTDGPGCNVGALRKYGQWRLISIGPDRIYIVADYSQYPLDVIFQMIETLYDPTNGTVSWGNIIRTQISPTGVVPQIRP